MEFTLQYRHKQQCCRVSVRGHGSEPADLYTGCRAGAWFARRLGVYCSSSRAAANTYAHVTAAQHVLLYIDARARASHSLRHTTAIMRLRPSGPGQQLATKVANTVSAGGADCRVQTVAAGCRSSDSLEGHLRARKCYCCTISACCLLSNYCSLTRSPLASTSRH